MLVRKVVNILLAVLFAGTASLAYAADTGSAANTAGSGSGPVFLNNTTSPSPSAPRDAAPVSPIASFFGGVTVSRPGKNLFKEQMDAANAEMAAKANAAANQRKLLLVQQSEERMNALRSKWAAEDKAKLAQKDGAQGGPDVREGREEKRSIVMPSSGDITSSGKPPRIFNVQ